MCTGFGIYLILEARKSAATVSMAIPMYIMATGLVAFTVGYALIAAVFFENSLALKTVTASKIDNRFFIVGYLFYRNPVTSTIHRWHSTAAQ